MYALSLSMNKDINDQLPLRVIYSILLIIIHSLTHIIINLSLSIIFNLCDQAMRSSYAIVQCIAQIWFLGIWRILILDHFVSNKSKKLKIAQALRPYISIFTQWKNEARNRPQSSGKIFQMVLTRRRIKSHAIFGYHDLKVLHALLLPARIAIIENNNLG